MALELPPRGVGPEEYSAIGAVWQLALLAKNSKVMVPPPLLVLYPPERVAEAVTAPPPVGACLPVPAR